MKGKESRNTYIIFALICLIVFNIGTILINIRSNKAEIGMEGETKAVFNQEDNTRSSNFFIGLFYRTSSIIKLYNNHEPSTGIWRYNISLGNKLKEIIIKKFSLETIFNRNSISASSEEIDENNIEMNPDVVEDFIIIDRLEEYEDFIVIKDSDGKVSPENAPNPLNIKPLNIDKEKPYILVYHTHGTESYSSLENKTHHTMDRGFNVTTIGEIMARTLEDNGHKVEHVTKYHDVPSYNKSYSESLKTANEKLKENNNLKILLDIHRDGYDHNDPNIIKNLKNLEKKSKMKIDGKDVATFFLVIGPDSPNKEAVLNFAKYVKAVSDALYPDLCTGIMIKPIGKYNQFLSDYSALMEIGSNLNTMDEAKETAKIVGEILSVVVEKIQE